MLNIYYMYDTCYYSLACLAMRDVDSVLRAPCV